MNFTDYPDSNPPPPGGRLLTDTDIVEMLRRAGAPPPQSCDDIVFGVLGRSSEQCTAPARWIEARSSISFLRALINHLVWLRPKSEVQRGQLQDRTVEGTIFDGCTMALKGIAMILGGIEDELDWLTDDLPTPYDPPSRVERRARLISNYERAICKLTETQAVLNELAAEAGEMPLKDFVFDVERADPQHLGLIHKLYEQITADTTLSKASSAVKFIALAMKEIGWKYPPNPKAIEQVLLRERKRRKRALGDATSSVSLDS